ncbi:MAG TPA: alpha/beta hydrolase, partial [Thermomicrobiales bacterium]|nr:alpha/beta hydrolase [Thermomicrobiales bacterium]
MLSVSRPANSLPPGVALERDVLFGTGGARPLRMHLLRPAARHPRPAPALVYIYGGAWLRGSRDTGLEVLASFAARGYLCASIEYRHSGEARFPAQIEDCKCAVRYLCAHADALAIDPDRIGVWGPSAGGHLAACLGTTARVPELEGDGGWSGFSSAVRAVCDWYGPSDFLQMQRAVLPGGMAHDSPD